MTNGLKYFRVWLRIRFLGSEKLTPRGILPRGVKKKFESSTFYKMKNVAL